MNNVFVIMIVVDAYVNIFADYMYKSVAKLNNYSLCHDIILHDI